MAIDDKKFAEWCGLNGPKPSSLELADYLERELDNREEVDAVEFAVTLHAVQALRQHDALVKALSAACGYMRNASIDLSTGCPKATAIKTIEGGLKLAEAALAEAKTFERLR